MSYGLHLRPLTVDEQRALEAALETKLRAEAARADIKDPIIRDLLPAEDLGFATTAEYWTVSVSAGAYRCVFSGTLPKDRIIGIMGVKTPAQILPFAVSTTGVASVFPRTSQIKFLHGTARTYPKDVWQIEQGHGDVRYAKAPVIYVENEGFNIDFYGRSSGADDQVVLIGKVIEPHGKVISPAGK